MKHRSCFVSNSSSTSFIIGIDRPQWIGNEDCANLQSIQDQLNDIEKELKRNPNEDWCLDRKRHLEEQLKELKEYARQNNKYVFDLSVPYGAEEVLDQLRDLEVLKGYEVLDESEG